MRVSIHGDIAQLVERLNGIEKVRGSTPLISTIPNAGVSCPKAFRQGTLESAWNPEIASAPLQERFLRGCAAWNGDFVLRCYHNTTPGAKNVHYTVLWAGSVSPRGETAILPALDDSNEKEVSDDEVL